MKINFHQKSTQIIVLLVLALVWGSSFILMKRGLDSFTANQVAAFRMVLAALFFLPATIKHFPSLNRKNIKYLLLAGFLGNFFPAYFFTTAEMHISSALAGMLNALSPFFTLVVGMSIYKIRVKWWNLIGIATGLIGASGLLLSGENAVISGDWKYAMLIVLATLFYGFNANIIHHNLKDLRAVAVASLAISFAGITSAIYLIFSDFSMAAKSPVMWQSFGYIVVLSLFGTTLALFAYNKLIKIVSALFATSVTYIIPIFAIIWGLLDGETIVPLQYMFMGIILAGVYLVNKR
jgi:drug/metabolite transporter (DMT)-like permease